MDNWHYECNPNGATVELHGNVRYLVCPHCGHTLEVDESDLVLLRKHKTRTCHKCDEGTLRFKIMLYDDEESEIITPENVWDQLEADLETADLVLWVGISFEQVRLSRDHSVSKSLTASAFNWKASTGVLFAGYLTLTTHSEVQFHDVCCT